MPAVATVVASFTAFAGGYPFYSRFLASRVFGPRPDHPTSAHLLEGGIDDLPTRPMVLPDA